MTDRSADARHPLVDPAAATLPPQIEALTLPPVAHASGSPGAIVVPGYEIVREVGRGGMGVVYQARQLGLNRVVALKMILAGAHAGADERQRFRQEAEAIARLQHPHIVAIHEIGEVDAGSGTPCPFFSLEYCSGGSLA